MTIPVGTKIRVTKNKPHWNYDFIGEYDVVPYDDPRLDMIATVFAGKDYARINHPKAGFSLFMKDEYEVIE